MKDNIDYYPHDSDSHNNAKFFTLRIKYGWAGEGMFWALNNVIAKSSGCRLDIGSSMRKAPVANMFGMDFDTLDSFIEYLEKECLLIVRDGDFITTKTVTETFQKVDAERGRARAKKTGKRQGSVEKTKSSTEKAKSSVELLKRVEKSKEKESKGKENAGGPAPDLEQISFEIEKYIKTKLRRNLSPLLPPGRYLPEVAAEIGRAAAGDGFSFNAKNPGSCKGLETWATSYVSRMEPAEETVSEPVDRSTTRYDQVIGIYQKVTGRLTSENQRQFLAPIVREYITKPGITDDQLRTAFNQLRSAGEVFDNLDYTLKNISKLLTWAQQSAA